MGRTSQLKPPVFSQLPSAYVLHGLSDGFAVPSPSAPLVIQIITTEQNLLQPLHPNAMADTEL